MKNIVDYDEMFAAKRNTKGKSEKKDQPDVFERDRLEREAREARLEEFRRRTKNREGFFERSDGFADIEYGERPKTFFSRSRYYDLKMLDSFIEYIDGAALGVLLAVLLWVVMKSFIAAVVAFDIGFAGGVFLKLIVHDGMTFSAAKVHAIPKIIETVIISVFVVLILKAK